jgi:tetratricopeptide (TPR) repeat protein
MKTYMKNGPAPDDFESPRYFYADPAGPRQFTGPIVLLTNRWAISAAENFALAMRVMPHATLIGDFTSGVFADVYGDRLPNGWTFGVSFKLFVDPTGFCWEGIGVPPDIRVINAPGDIEAGRDRVLELALDFLGRGQPSPEFMERSEVVRASTADLRESFTEYLLAALDVPPGSADPQAAAVQATQSAVTHQRQFHVDLWDLTVAAEALRAEGRGAAADAVLHAAGEVFPRASRPYQMLGEARLAEGDMDGAREAFGRSLDRNPLSYPWERSEARIARAVVDGKRILSAELASADSWSEGRMVLDAFESDPAGWYVDESELNQLGYRFLRDGMTDVAIEVFRVNAEQFPESANVWDSLGDGYRAAGDREAAIASYRRALEIDPGFAASRQNLAQLEAAQGG